MIIQFLLDLLRDTIMLAIAGPVFLYPETLLGFFPALIAATQYVNAFMGTVLPGDGWTNVFALITVTFGLAVLAPISRFIIKILRN